jgi:hypothetical protein
MMGVVFLPLRYLDTSVLFSCTFLCITLIRSSLWRLQRDLHMGSFSKTNPFLAVCGGFGCH